jgi:hypothetical protein
MKDAPLRKKRPKHTDSQHGKVDMLKAARSTVAEPVVGNFRLGYNME